MWSEEKKMLELVELTVPFEDNIEDARLRKDKRYEQLVDDCCEAGWNAWHSPIEIGCRGFVGASVEDGCLKPDFQVKKQQD